MTREPKLLSDGGDALAAAISATREQLPSNERLEALAARLSAAGARVEDARGPLSTVAPRPAPRTELRLMKLLEPGTLAVVAALLVGAGLIALAIVIREGDVPLTPASSVPAAERAPGVVPSNGERVHGEVAQQHSAPSGRSDSARAQARSGAEAAAAPTDAPSAANGPTPVAPADPPSGASTASALNEPAASAPAVAQAQGSRPTSAPRARDSALGPSPDSDGPLAENTVVETEVELLKKARSALGADAIQAFALTERCRAQYPNGSFSQEREYIAIAALARMGRTDEARSRASLFRRHYANSAYLPRLARILGEE